MQVDREAYAGARNYMAATVELNKAREAERDAKTRVEIAEGKLQEAEADLIKIRGTRPEIFILCQGYVVQVNGQVLVKGGVAYNDWEIQLLPDTTTQNAVHRLKKVKPPMLR